MRVDLIRILAAVFCCLLLCSTQLLAQSVPGNLKGVVKDTDGKPIPSAEITVSKQGEIVRGDVTDDGGNYSIPSLEPGAYEVKADDGTGNSSIRPVQISSGKSSVENFSVGSTTFDEIVIREEMISADQVIHKDEKSLADLQALGTRSITSAVAMGSGVYQADEGRALSVRGGRSDATQTFVDGMRVIGGSGVPQLSIKSVSLITGGTPPWYGDVTSGVIEIESADPSPEHHFGGELLTSQFTDAERYNLAAITASGPILKRLSNPNDSTSYKITKLGYFVGAEVSIQRDPSPPGIDLYRLPEDRLEEIERNPLVPFVTGGQLSFVNATNFLRRSDFETVNYKLNNDRLNTSLNMRLDYKLNSNTTIKVGGNYSYFRGDIWDRRNQAFAPDENQFRVDNNGRAYVRFSQFFIPENKDNSIIKSITYNLQADFTRITSVSQNRDFQDDYFKYGHVGRFYLNHDGSNEFLPNREVAGYQPVFPGTALHNPNYSSDGYWQTSGFQDTSLVFDGSNSSNPKLARYNEVIYDYLRDNPRPFFNPSFGDFGSLRSGVRNINDMIVLGGMVNGQTQTSNGFGPTNQYSINTMPGQVFAGFSKSRQDMYRLTGYATVELGKKASSINNEDAGELKGTHTLRIGFEFDQRVERAYSLGAASLWRIMRQSANSHFDGVDASIDSQDPVYVEGPNGERYFQDTVQLSRSIKPGSQTNFDRNLRRKLGLQEDSRVFVNTDYYDPSFYSLDMFSADELLNNGNALVNYFGYDYKGNIAGDEADGDYFTNENLRPQNAFRPTYAAGYIQDKFELENIFFSLGLRVDRLDLNQPVLKDPYVMAPFFTAKEAASRGNFSLPSNIGEDWVPYIDQKIESNEAPLEQKNIKGYRDGKTWYDQNGAPVDPTLLQVNGEVIPYYRIDSLTFDAFQDYEPQINVMPRVSLSFSVTDQANFFAHYDVLTQRPTGFEIGQMYNYQFIETNATEVISNPALRPQRTIDYEVGFQQALDQDQNASIVISAFYREMRDMIQSFRYQNAYPITYDSYENLDFGTVKGLTFEFRTASYRMVSIRANYTLQYAEGTGSGFNTARNAVAGIPGFSVIRNLLPFSFDQRHTITSNVVLRFDDKKNKGPKIGNKDFYPLKNSSASLTFRGGSGTPYTRNALPNQADVQFGVNSTIQTLGTPNGSRLPFNFNLDLRLDKIFNLHVGGKKDEEGKKTGGRHVNLTTYVVFMNLLNIQNTLGVYGFSGQPNTSGFLSSQQGERQLIQQIDPEAFRDQFTMFEQDPNNFNLPRRIRFGVLFGF